MLFMDPIKGFKGHLVRSVYTFIKYAYKKKKKKKNGFVQPCLMLPQIMPTPQPCARVSHNQVTQYSDG